MSNALKRIIARCTADTRVRACQTMRQFDWWMLELHYMAVKGFLWNYPYYNILDVYCLIQCVSTVYSVDMSQRVHDTNMSTEYPTCSDGLSAPY